MKISLTISVPGSKTAPIIFQGDYSEEIVRAARIGYKAVELHIRDPKAIDQKAIRRSLEETGIRVSTIGTGLAFGQDRIFLASPDEGVRRAAIQRIRDQIDFASELRAHVIIGLIKGPLPESEPERGLARQRMVDGLRECADYARKADVQLPVEAINRYESNFLNTAGETHGFIQEVGSPCVGIHLDTYHMNIEEVSIEEAIKRHADRLIHIHLADSNRWAPGMGHLDFKSILTALKEVRYQGALGLECLPRPDAETAARSALRFLKEVMPEDYF